MRTIVKGLFLLAALAATLVHAQISQIQHVIVVIQENRTPDNLFQTASTLITNGADIASSGLCGTNNIPLTGQMLEVCWSPNHRHNPSWTNMWDHGKMDNACANTVGGCNNPPPNAQYTYVLNTEWDTVHHYHILDPYFQLAGWYGYANYMFQTNMGPSFPAHQFLFSGTSAPIYSPQNYFDSFAAENPGNVYQTGCVAPVGQVVEEIPPNDPYNTEVPGYTPVEPWPAAAGFPCYEHPTMTDLLDGANIKWRYYNYQNLGKSPYGAYMWNAPFAIQHLCFPLINNGQQCNGPHFNDGSIVTTGPEQILTDIQSCNLQPVSWVIPDGKWSDHPGNTYGDAGPSWLAAIYNGVGGYDPTNNCGYWNNTVILATWDDWGGFYDHVNPDPLQTGYSNHTAGQYVYGFRVPLLVISKYARPRYISGPCQNGSCQNYKQPYIHDFGSILRFTEKVFGLGQIDDKNNYDYADAQAPDAPPTCTTCLYSLADFFDFTHQNTFQPILHPKYNADYFIDYYANGNQPDDPDDDVIDND
jgi:phospholipase C